MVQLEEKGSSK